VDCANIDEQVVRPQDDELKALVEQFVCVRVTRMNDVDISPGRTHQTHPHYSRSLDFVN